MSKICNRGYRDDNMLTTKVINGIGYCPACEQPVMCHHTTVKERALFWALSGSTGTSSKAIAKHMTGFSSGGRFDFMPPSDADDRRRCIKLLELIPEWIVRIKEMIEYDTIEQEGIIINSSGIGADHNTWQEQIPIILRDGKL